MADKLQVDLVAGNADKAVADVKKFQTTLVSADAQVNALSAKSAALIKQDFSSAIASVERQALNLQFTLRKIGEVSVNSKGVDGLGKAALRADAELSKTYARLRQIEAEAAVAKDPAILKRLQAEAAKTSGDLDRLQNKLERVAAGRSAAADRVAARNVAAGSGFNGRGLLNSAAAGFIPGAFEASAGLDAAAAAGIGAASLVALGAVAAAGLAIVKISEHLRAEAEKHLHAEENIAIAVNKTVIAAKEQLKTFQEADKLRERQSQFQDELANQGVADRKALTERIALLKQLRDADPNGPNAGEFDSNIQAGEQRLKALDKQSTDAANASFEQRNEIFKRSQAQAAEFQKQQVEAGIARVTEIKKSADELFAGLFAKQGEKNPFVQIFTEAEKAIEATRVATAGLSDELRNQAEQMVKTAEANSLFSARLDARLAASDLRTDARRFRNGGGTADADRRATEQIAAFIRNNQAGFFRNTDNLQPFFAGTSPKTALQLFDFKRQLDESGGLFRNPIFQDEQRRRLAIATGADETAQERLDRQLDIIRKLEPANDAQRAEADRKIIALTSGLNPADLSDAGRNAAAAARENEAARTINLEASAKAEKAAEKVVQKSIDDNIAALLAIAQSDGLTGVIRIINNAENDAAVSLGNRPTPKDTSAMMSR